MGPKKTGDPPVKFEYFTEFDQIFGKEHNIKPVAVASSMMGGSSTSCETPDEGSEGSEKPTKKRKKLQDREASKQRQQHEESMKIKREALDTFKEYMDKLLEK